jgi:tellurite resistance protein TerC
MSEIAVVPPSIWLAFTAGIVSLLCLDAFVLNPNGREMSMRRAVAMTGFWILLAILFNIGVYYWMGEQRAVEFLTAYVVEQSLSVDNIFVFILIFAHFKVPLADQHKILLWGILSAQVMRGVFILAGVAVLAHFHWMMYIFGAVLVITGFKVFFKKDEDDIHPENNFILKLVGKKLSLFWVVLIIIETTDLIFAIDSIPAVLAITKDPFIAYTSNIFAILGLRAMYFALAGFLKVLHHLHYGLGVILVFIGLKMLLEHYITVPIVVALGFIVLTLTVTVFTSLLCRPKNPEN